MKRSLCILPGHLGRLITISAINDFQLSLGLQGPTLGPQSNPVLQELGHTRNQRLSSVVKEGWAPPLCQQIQNTKSC